MIRIIPAERAQEQLAAMRARAAQKNADIDRAVADIMQTVKVEGLAAVERYSMQFDRTAPYEISAQRLEQAYQNCPDELIAALEQENIEARHVWKPLHRQPLYAHCLYYPHSETLSVADQLFATGVCLPSGSNLTDDEQARVIDCVRKVIAGKTLRTGGKKVVTPSQTA